MISRILFVVVTIWLASIDVGAGTADWITLENCRLVPNAANDGDSFHVSVNGKEYIFRLYLVEPAEVYPNSDAWGVDAFTFTDKEAAFAKLREVAGT